MITIVDYGLGNILSFMNVYKRLNVGCTIAREASELEGASKIILPGVGSFDHAMTSLEKSGMRALLDEMVLVKGVPVLGICVGMQMLASRSEEGQLDGLGWVKGSVKRFNAEQSLQLPHMGWNDVSPVRSKGLFNQLVDDSRFYFLHSYYFECEHSEDILAVSAYGSEFTCSVNSKNIYGVQFHPEKSHHYGVQLLKNFSEI